eukprot:127007_1
MNESSKTTIPTPDSDIDHCELNFPLQALQHITSNPLERCDSNVSYTSQEGNATFVPFGRGHVNNDFIDYSLLNQALDDIRMDVPSSTHPTLAPLAPLAPLSPRNESHDIKHDNSEKQDSISDRSDDNKPKQHKKKKKKASSSGWMEMSDLIKMRLSLTDLLNDGLLCRFFKDQNGSRYVQEQLKNASSEIIDEILKHIIFTKYEILNLSHDVYGNYVVQMLFEIGNSFHYKLLIHHLLKGNVSRLTHSFYGCRVIQTAFNHIPHNECIPLVHELNNRSAAVSTVTDCVLGQNAHHVIQKVLSLNLDVQHIKFIIDCVQKDIYFYSQHIFGCRVVQSIINNYGKSILAQMANDEALILKMCTSEYANYVIQDILSLSNGDNMQSMVTFIVFANVAVLSKNKFGSNVVEQCLASAKDHERDIVLKQMIGKVSILIEMVHDRYGNYVVQKLLTYSNHKQQSKLIYLLEKHIPNLASLKYGKHIMDKIKRIRSKYKSRSSNRYY